MCRVYQVVQCLAHRTKGTYRSRPCGAWSSKSHALTAFYSCDVVETGHNPSCVVQSIATVAHPQITLRPKKTRTQKPFACTIVEDVRGTIKVIRYALACEPHTQTHKYIHTYTHSLVAYKRHKAQRFLSLACVSISRFAVADASMYSVVFYCECAARVVGICDVFIVFFEAPTPTHTHTHTLYTTAL